MSTTTRRLFLHAFALGTGCITARRAFAARNDSHAAGYDAARVDDWMSRLDPSTLAQAFQLPPQALAGIPDGETYINQGAVLAFDGAEALSIQELPHTRTAGRTCFGVQMRKLLALTLVCLSVALIPTEGQALCALIKNPACGGNPYCRPRLVRHCWTYPTRLPHGPTVPRPYGHHR